MHGHHEVARIAAAPVCAQRPDEFLPKYPHPTAHERRREAALREALMAGAVPLRDPHKLAMLKPVPMMYKPDMGHLHNCTLCTNQEAARVAARRHQLRMVSGAVHLLADDAALETWSCVVHELERPRKARVKFQQARAPDADAKGNAAPTRAHAMPRMGFGMPGTVLHEGGRFRAWLGQAIQRYAESTDGLVFDEPRGVERGLRWVEQIAQHPQATTAAGQHAERVRINAAKKYWGEHGDAMVLPRPVEHETFTVTADPGARDPSQRYKAALTCDLLGHAPYPDYWKYKRGTFPERSVWLAAPIFNGERHYTWESTCLAYSADGFNWTLYDLGHHIADGPPSLRTASDTANVLYPRLRSPGAYHVVNRWAAPIPPGEFGTPPLNPNWWREVRGVRISSTTTLDAAAMPRVGGGGVDGGGKGGGGRGGSGKGGEASGGAAIEFSEASHWIFDREGKTEHLRRQVYSLQVTPLAESDLYIGLLNVLEWPKLINPVEQVCYPRSNSDPCTP